MAKKARKLTGKTRKSTKKTIKSESEARTLFFVLRELSAIVRRAREITGRPCFTNDLLKQSLNRYEPLATKFSCH